MDANAGVDLTRSCIDFVAVTEELCSQTTDVAAPVGSSVVTTAGAVQRFAYNQLRDAVRCIKESTCRLDPITPWEGELGDRLRWKHSLAKIREDCKQFGQSLESIYANAQEAFRSQLGWSELELDLSLREIELLHCEAMVYLKHAQQRLVKLEEGISCPTASPQDEFFWNVDLMDAVPLTIGETLRLQRGHTYLFIVEQPWTLLRVQVYTSGEVIMDDHLGHYKEVTVNSRGAYCQLLHCTFKSYLDPADDDILEFDCEPNDTSQYRTLTTNLAPGNYEEDLECGMVYQFVLPHNLGSEYLRVSESGKAEVLRGRFAIANQGRFALRKNAGTMLVRPASTPGFITIELDIQ